VERTTVRGRLTWELATVSRLVLEILGWLGHLPGQHVDVRLTAEDGYQTQRSYSIASHPEERHVVLTLDTNLSVPKPSDSGRAANPSREFNHQSTASSNTRASRCASVSPVAPVMRVPAYGLAGCSTAIWVRVTGFHSSIAPLVPAHISVSPSGLITSACMIPTAVANDPCGRPSTSHSHTTPVISPVANRVPEGVQHAV
jgi:hypothetical protein